MRHGVRGLNRGSAPAVALVSTLALVLVGCDAGRGAQSPSDAALRDTLGIGPRVALHRVALGGERDREFIDPQEVFAREGDVVAFETVDGRIHELAFEPDSLSPDVLQFLRETGQLESPLLMERGTRFLVDFHDAPDGRYVFRGRTVGLPVFATILIGVDPP